MEFLKVSFESVPSCIRRRFSRPPTSHPPASAHPSTRPRHRPTARPPARPPVRAAGHDRPARPPTPTARPTHRAGQPPPHPGGGYHHGGGGRGPQATSDEPYIYIYMIPARTPNNSIFLIKKPPWVSVVWVVIACCICSQHDPCICSKKCNVTLSASNALVAAKSCKRSCHH